MDSNRKTLSPGTRLGEFEVIELLGVGGMGEVYLAHDSKLGRDVAIKVLPEAFSREPERLERLEREARLLAAMNHPNIATLYGFEQFEGISFLVMERVSGETLADRLKAGPMPIDEALPLFAQIAEGLEAAHERGIIHRDLKPANIKITDEQKVKILDFGLGKSLPVIPARSTEGATQPITPSPYPVTGEGTILGTPAYMSPEQARGKSVDKRVDIWAFGCCLYETLTGKRPFEGETASDAIAKILEAEPDWEALPKDTPPRIRNLLWRCLQKDPQRRLRDVGEAWFEMSQVESGEAEVLALPSEVATAGRFRRCHLVFVGLTCLVLGSIVTAVILWNTTGVRVRPPGQTARPNVVRSVILPHSRIADEALFHIAVAISPDGRRIAYVDQGTGTERMVYVQELNETSARPILGTEGAIDPFFSPDGEWVGYADHTRGTLEVASVQGGTPKTLTAAPDFRGGVWLEDGTIVFCPRREVGLWSIQGTGGDLRQVTTTSPEKGDVHHEWPDTLPNSDILFTSSGEKEGIWETRLEVLSRADGRRHAVLSGALFGRYLASGHLVFIQETSLYGARLDLRSLKLLSKPAPLPERIQHNSYDGTTQIACSNTGTMVFIQAASSERELVWVDDRGQVEPLGAPRREYGAVSLSPDGTQVALSLEAKSIISPFDSDIWLFDIARGILTQLTSDTLSGLVQWLDESRQLAGLRYIPAENKCDLLRFYVDGSRGEELMALSQGLYPSIDKDRRFILGVIYLAEGNDEDIVVWSLENPTSPKEILVADPSWQRSPVFSPDGRWFAYSSHETGTWEIYVRPFPGPGKKTRISTDGGIEPRWDAYRNKLYYRNRDEMWAVTYEAETEFKPSQPQFLFKRHFFGGVTDTQTYSVAKDGRFLMIREDLEPGTQINLVANWFEELNRLIPPEKK